MKGWKISSDVLWKEHDHIGFTDEVMRLGKGCGTIDIGWEDVGSNIWWQEGYLEIFMPVNFRAASIPMSFSEAISIISCVNVVRKPQGYRLNINDNIDNAIELMRRAAVIQAAPYGRVPEYCLVGLSSEDIMWYEMTL